MRDPFDLAFPDHFERRRAIAVFIVRKYRQARAARGTQATARALRKQGVPIEYALLILGIRSTWRVPAVR